MCETSLNDQLYRWCWLLSVIKSSFRTSMEKQLPLIRTEGVTSIQYWWPQSIRPFFCKTWTNFKISSYATWCILYHFFFRNTLSAPSKFDLYSGSIFPSLKDSLYEVQHTSPPEDRDWEPVKKAFSILTYYVVSATSTLQKSTQFTKMEN